MRFPLLLTLVMSLSAAETSIWFEENIGQTDSRVRYLARTRQATVFVTDTETVYSLRGSGDKKATVRMTLDGERRGRWTSEEKKPLIVSSFVGGQAYWRERISTFGRLRRAGVYPGVDLVYYGKGREIEYDFELQRGSDAGRVRMRFDGARDVRIGTSGDLEIQTAAGVLVHRRPVVFQGGKNVDARYVAHKDGAFGVALGSHDPARPLTIDPVVNFARFYGGDGEDVITGMSGSSVAGYTNSAVFPGNTQPAAGGYDAFFLTYGAEQRAAYVGGSGDDKAYAVSASVNTLGIVEYAFAGETNSRDFPVMQKALTELVTPARLGLTPPQPSYGGGESDGFYFWSTFRLEGTFVSSYIGGSGTDRALGVYASSGVIAVVGETDSTDFPRPAGVPASGPAGGTDGFYFWQSSPDSPAIWSSTLFGGSGNDRLTHLSSLDVAAGTTDSDDLPVLKAFQWQRGGGRDGMVVQFGISGKVIQPLFASYLGGSGDDEVTAVRFTGGRGIAAGTTSSANFPGAPEGQFQGGTDGFICEFDLPTATVTEAIRKSRLIGGTGNDSIRAAWLSGIDPVISSSDVRELYFVGTTNSTDLPVQNPLQPGYGGGASDVMVGLYTIDGEVPFLSYYGGPGKEEGAGGGTSEAGLPLLAGNTDSGNLPGAGAAGQPSYSGGTDGFLLSFQLPILQVTGRLAAKGGVIGTTVGASVLPENKPVRLTIRSTDPSRLQLSYTGDYVAREQLETDWDGKAYSFQYVGSADSGSVDVVVSAEGFVERRVPVRLVPTEVILYLWSAGQIGGGKSEMRFPSTTPADLPVVAQLDFVARESEKGLQVSVFYPRPGAPDPQVQVISTNPDVVRMLPTTANWNSRSDGWPGVVNGPGETLVSVQVRGAGETLESKPLRVIRMPAMLRMDLPVVASHWLTPASVSTGLVTAGQTVTVTSLDPDSALLARNVNDVPVASLTLPLPAHGGPAEFLVQGAAIGATARLRASAPGFSDVELEQTVLPVSYSLSSTDTTVAAGAAGRVGIQFGVVLPAGGFINGYAPPSGTPVRLRVTSSDPQVVSVLSETVAPPQGGQSLAVEFQGVSAGSAALTLTGEGGVVPAGNRDRVTVRVVPVQAAGPLKLSPVTVGKDLQGELNITLPGTPVTVTVTSGDPSKLLISTTGTTVGSGSATSTNVSGQRAVYLQALAGEGTVRVTVQAGGVTETTEVYLVPSFAAILPLNEISTVLLGTVDFSAGFYAKLPGSWSGLAYTRDLSPVGPLTALKQGSLRPGFALPEIRIESSDPAVGQAEMIGAVSRTNARFRFRSKAVGVTDLRLQMTGSMEMDPRSRSIRARVGPSTFSANWSHRYLFKDSILPLMPLPWLSNAENAYSAETIDPSKALLSAQAAGPPEGAITVPLTGGYVWGMADSGQGGFRVRSRYAGEVLVPFEAAPSALTYMASYSRYAMVGRREPSDPIPGTAGGQIATLSFGVTDAEGISGYFAPLQPSVETRLQLEVSPPGALELSATEIVASRSMPVTVKGLREGRAVVRVTPLDGYPMVTGAREIQFQVELPSIPGLPASLVLAKDMQWGSSLSDVTGTATLTSSNPEVLLLSPSLQIEPFGPVHAGQESIETTGGRSVYYLMPVGVGTATLEVKVDGYRTARIPVQVIPLRFQATAPERIPLQSSSARLTLAISDQSVSASGYRLGAPPFSLRVENDRPDVLSVASELNSPGGALSLQPLRDGTATLRLIPPQGITVQPAELTIRVFLPSLDLGNIPNETGKHGYSLFRAPAVSGPVTIRSADPSRLAFGLRPADAPAGTLTVAGGTELTLFGLETGTVEVLVEAEGYQPTGREVQVRPTGFVFLARELRMTVNGGVRPATVGMTLIDPVSGNRIGGAGIPIRPGLTVQVPISSSDRSIADTDKSTIPILSIANLGRVNVTPLSNGVVSFMLGTPDGFVSARDGQVMTVTVVDARMSGGMPAALANQLATKAWLYLAESPPAGGVRILLESSDPSRVVLSAQPMGPRSGSLELSVRQGVSSVPYYVHGMADSGSVTVTATAPRYETLRTGLSLYPPGVRLSTGILSGAVGQTGEIAFFFAPIKGGETESGAFWFSALDGPRVLQLRSDNEAVIKTVELRVDASQFETRQSFPVRLLSKGTATLRLQVPPGFVLPANESSYTQIVTVK